MTNSFQLQKCIMDILTMRSMVQVGMWVMPQLPDSKILAQQHHHVMLPRMLYSIPAAPSAGLLVSATAVMILQTVSAPKFIYLFTIYPHHRFINFFSFADLFLKF